MKFYPQVLLFVLAVARGPPPAPKPPPLHPNCPGPGSYCVDSKDGCCPGLQCLYDRGRSACHNPCGLTGGWCPHGQKCYTADDNKTIMCMDCFKHGEEGCIGDWDCCTGPCIQGVCHRPP